MTDTEVTLVAAFGGVVLGTVLAWLGERGRRRFEARTRLAEERGEAWTRLAATATEAYMTIEHTVRQYQSARWWDGQGIAQFWLARQGYRRSIEVGWEMRRTLFDVRRLGPPAAVEHAKQLVASVEATATLAQQPRSRHAKDPQTWAELLEQLVTPREALLELSSPRRPFLERARWGFGSGIHLRRRVSGLAASLLGRAPPT
jgi:hypothetical protein